jgi:hypothetical protein
MEEKVSDGWKRIKAFWKTYHEYWINPYLEEEEEDLFYGDISDLLILECKHKIISQEIKELRKLKKKMMNTKRFDSDNIKKRFSEFPDYEFGFEASKSVVGQNALCYGIGWNKNNLYMINVTEKGVVYAYCSMIEYTNDKIIAIPYKQDFFIPKNESEFLEFLAKQN